MNYHIVTPPLTLVRSAPKRRPTRSSRNKRACFCIARRWLEKMLLTMVSLDQNLNEIVDDNKKFRLQQLRMRFFNLYTHALNYCEKIEHVQKGPRRDYALQQLNRTFTLMELLYNKIAKFDVLPTQ